MYALKNGKAYQFKVVGPQSATGGVRPSPVSDDGRDQVAPDSTGDAAASRSAGVARRRRRRCSTFSPKRRSGPRRAVQPTGPRDSRRVSITSARATGELFVAEVDRVLVATLTLQWSDVFFWGDAGGRRDAGYVHRLAVRRAHAGVGLGRPAARLGRRADSGAGPDRGSASTWSASNGPLRRYYEAPDSRTVVTSKARPCIRTARVALANEPVRTAAATAEVAHGPGDIGCGRHARTVTAVDEGGHDVAGIRVRECGRARQPVARADRAARAGHACRGPLARPTSRTAVPTPRRSVS